MVRTQPRDRMSGWRASAVGVGIVVGLSLGVLVLGWLLAVGVLVVAA